MFRIVGLLTICIATILLLSSFRPIPEFAFEPPARVIETGRPAPLPYNLPIQYAVWVIRYCDETGVPVWLASRMFGQESVGNPMAGVWNERAVSWTGARGLAQLMPWNLILFAQLYNDGRPIDPFDPEVSIKVGIRYLADLHAATGSWRIALMAYNGGLGHWLNPRRWGTWLPESVDYVRAILREGS